MVLTIFKMIATSGFLTALECTEFVFGRGSAPDPTRGAYSALSDPLAGLRGSTSKGKGRKRGKREIKREEGDARNRPSLSQISGSAPARRLRNAHNVLITGTTTDA